jgi:tRNA threonylcarbamoyladenosine biosynthesis protein TsaE
VTREVVLVTRGPQDTRQIGAAIAAALRPGDVVSLSGELGAGKTCFVQGAAAALGVTDRVTSPSFLLRRDYRGTVPVLHLDVYRLDSLQEVVELGYEEALDAERVTFVEWGDAMSPLLPSDHLEVELHLGSADEEAAEPPEGAPADPDEVLAEARRIVVRARGDDWLRRMAVLEPTLAHWRAGESTEQGGAVAAEET